MGEKVLIHAESDGFLSFRSAGISKRRDCPVPRVIRGQLERCHACANATCHHKRPV